MSYRFPFAILTAVGAIESMSIAQSFAAVPLQAPTLTAASSLDLLAQTPEELRQQQLERQAEAERVLKEGERQRQEIRNQGLGGTEIERRVNDEVTKIRESGSDPQKVRDANAELGRLRQERQNVGGRYYIDPFYFPYGYGDRYYYRTTPGPIIFTTPIFTPIPSYTPNSGSPDYEYNVPQDRVGQENRSTRRAEDDKTQLLASAGFKDGQIAPAVGVRWNNIGFEIAGVFNQDTFSRSVNDFSLPSNFLFDDLGVKKLSPQWGGDLLGFFDVAPKVSLYGSVGIYFQSLSRIAQSQATQELYKQTNDTNVSGAIGGGVNYSPGDNISIGVGYHSLRGITARMGINF
jgi:opacity protein-like surface antigen